MRPGGARGGDTVAYIAGISGEGAVSARDRAAIGAGTRSQSSPTSRALPAVLTARTLPAVDPRTPAPASCLGTLRMPPTILPGGEGYLLAGRRLGVALATFAAWNFAIVCFTIPGATAVTSDPFAFPSLGFGIERLRPNPRRLSSSDPLVALATYGDAVVGIGKAAARPTRNGTPLVFPVALAGL